MFSLFLLALLVWPRFMLPLLGLLILTGAGIW